MSAIRSLEPPAAAPSDAREINLAWLLRLRWVAIIGQVTIILGVTVLLGIVLPLPPIAAIIGFEVATNAACALWARRAFAVTDAVLVGLLTADVVLLTALLYLTGGPVNPFSFLYLVHIALGAVTLRPVHTWGLTALALLGFGLLFFLPAWPGGTDMATMHADHEHMRLHLEGMYVAFGVAAVFIVYFVQRVTAALAQRDAELTAARSLAQRHEMFASLGTLAAGAAHELATPLSTIAVAAREMERNLQRGVSSGEALDDIRLIRQQVMRCQNVLQQMAADAGQGMGENLEVVRAADLLDQALAGSIDEAGVEVAVDDDAATLVVTVPPHAMAQALRGVVRNAHQASSSAQPVQVHVCRDGSDLHIEVRDGGAGMEPSILQHAGEPFFTTKAPGEGMGLGLFLTRSLLGRLGGRLELSSVAGSGTSAVLVLPVASNGRRADQ